MERFLRKRFLGQKQFSLEGLDVMIPMLDETIELASEAGAHEVVLGMAHRGRLNVLAHTIGMPYEYILREFEGERAIEAVAVDPEGGTGDVKYHLAANGTRTTSNGKVGVRLVANPSHLEAVDPVVEGRTRAEQTDRSTPNGAHDPSVALPVLLHGDAAFAGQGIVAETFNLHGLEGYSTGGTLHLITNNQIGFTTDPNEGRSTRYSSDLAKGFDVPIIHVNADDPGGVDRCRPALDGLSAPLRPGRRHRPRRLSALRTQRAGRSRLHATADGRADQRAPFRAGALRGAADRGRRADAGRSSGVGVGGRADAA